MHALMVDGKPEWRDSWAECLRDLLPGFDIRTPAAPGNPDEITCLLSGRPQDGLLDLYPNLQVIFSEGAGVDRVMSLDLPERIVITRVVDDNLNAMMTEYVVWAVLAIHRDAARYREAQAAASWTKQPERLASQRPVGILGLGTLGTDAAIALRSLHFPVAGWSRTPREIPGIACFHGADMLGDFLARSEILVCLLPLTPETRGIIDASLLDRLPRGAGLVNAARGGHVVQADLIAALDRGQISHAVLDVTDPEPLPPDDPLWRRADVTITPHVASITTLRSASISIADNIKRLMAGQPLTHLVDRSRGY